MSAQSTAECDLTTKKCQPCEGGVPPLGEKRVAELLANGKIKQIVESYDVPFYPPFS